MKELKVYIWSEENYRKGLPLADWDYPIIPDVGDKINIDGQERIIGRIRRTFEPIGNDLIINVIVRFI